MLKCSKTELNKQRLQEPMGKKFVAQYVNKNGIPCMEDEKTSSNGKHQPDKDERGNMGRITTALQVGKIGACQVCRRIMPLTRHHATPRSQRTIQEKLNPQNMREQTIKLCVDCHLFLHKTFTNEVLEARLFNLEAILADQQVSQHIKARRRDARNGVPLAHPRKDT